MTREITSFAQLRDLEASLRASKVIAARVATRVAARLSELAQESFDAGQSVYGTSFEGKHGSLDLKESGRLRGKALRYEAHGTKVRCSVASVPYARYLIKHGILPRTGTLPSKWSDEITRIANDEIAKALNGAVR